MKSRNASSWFGLLISLQVFRRYIVLWDLVGVNFSHVWIRSIFHAADHFGLEGLSFLD